MMKKSISLLLVLLLILSLPVLAFAGSGSARFIVDDANVLNKPVIDELNSVAEEFYSSTGVAVCLYIVRDESGVEPQDLAEGYHNTIYKPLGINDTIILVHNIKSGLIGISLDGSAANYVDGDGMSALLNAYNDSSSYDGGIRDYLSLAASYLGGSIGAAGTESAGSIQASEGAADDSPGTAIPTVDPNIPTEHLLPLVVDRAGLLTPEELAELLNKAETISRKYECDVAIVTVNGTDGKSAQDYADDFYDYQGYGYGEGDDGILLLIDMLGRDMHITTFGFGIEAVTDAGIEYLFDAFTQYMSAGDYYRAFNAFLDKTEYLYDMARNRAPFDVDTPIKEPVTIARLMPRVLLALVLGGLAGAIPVGVMKRKLRSIAQKTEASRYIRPGSFALTHEQDRFIRSAVSRVPIPKQETSRSSSSFGGGSSTHFSSSGRSHGGGGRKF